MLQKGIIVCVLCCLMERSAAPRFFFSHPPPSIPPSLPPEVPRVALARVMAAHPPCATMMLKVVPSDDVAHKVPAS
jgi:hypothetical protein